VRPCAAPLNFPAWPGLNFGFKQANCPRADFAATWEASFRVRSSWKASGSPMEMLVAAMKWYYGNRGDLGRSFPESLFYYMGNTAGR
jgi:hypothetical protein